jgi:hypothetical protein
LLFFASGFEVPPHPNLDIDLPLIQRLTSTRQFKSNLKLPTTALIAVVDHYCVGIRAVIRRPCQNLRLLPLCHYVVSSSDLVLHLPPASASIISLRVSTVLYYLPERIAVSLQLSTPASFVNPAIVYFTCKSLESLDLIYTTQLFATTIMPTYFAGGFSVNLHVWDPSKKPDARAEQEVIPLDPSIGHAIDKLSEEFFKDQQGVNFLPKSDSPFYLINAGRELFFPKPGDKKAIDHSKNVRSGQIEGEALSSPLSSVPTDFDSSPPFDSDPRADGKPMSMTSSLVHVDILIVIQCYAMVRRGVGFISNSHS